MTSASFVPRHNWPSYAGLGPTPHQSGTSIRGDRVTRFGNHRLKNAFFLAAFSSLQHPPSRTYSDRKRSQGKRHTQAVLCLARRRVDVLHAMLTTNTPYQAPLPRADLEKAARVRSGSYLLGGGRGSDGVTGRKLYMGPPSGWLVRCGRCPSSSPYWYAYWKDYRGVTHKQYIGKHLPVTAQATVR